MSLAGKLRDQALASGQARRAILPLLAAVQALAPTPEHVTPIHAFALQWCAAELHSTIRKLPSIETIDASPALLSLYSAGG